MTLSLRTRLTLGNVGLLALALLAFAAATRFVVGRVFWGKLDQMLTAQAERPIQRLLRQEQFPPPNFLRPPPPSEEMGTPFPPRLWLPEGPSEDEPWSAEGLAAVQKGGVVWAEVAQDGTPLRVRTEGVVRGDQLLGVVQTAVPTAPTQAALNSVTYSLVLLLPLLALVAALGGLWLTHRALAPVRQLTEAAGQIEAERLGERLPEPGGGDEFDQLTQMLNRSLARLDEAFSRQRQFTSHASHELRTPLATIKTALGLLRHPQLTPELRTEALTSADDATDRASRLVTDLLFLARSQSGTLPVRPATFRLAETLVPVVPAPARLEIAPELTVTTDRDLLLRLVSNLVSNALRHTPESGTVTVTATETSLTVTDTGCGIAPEHLAQLGQPFWRPETGRTRDDGGVGLGLSICYALTAALGGELVLTSELGKGTQATLTL